jgi:hypothetical protein
VFSTFLNVNLANHVENRLLADSLSRRCSKALIYKALSNYGLKVTVIATGFVSTRRREGATSGNEASDVDSILDRIFPRRRPQRMREGFPGIPGNRISQDDLDIPTFLRIDGPDVQESLE